MKFIKIPAAILILIFGSLTVLAQTTAFSYQGRLSEAGVPAMGTRFFRFTLFDENGVAIPGATIDQTLIVTGGVFNTTLDFGAGAFPGGEPKFENLGQNKRGRRLYGFESAPGNSRRAVCDKKQIC